MSRGIRVFLMVLCSYLVSTEVQAQVSSVKYYLKFDTSSCLYNVNVVITGGSATSIGDRAQFNAQISIVLPNTDSLVIVDRFMPLQNNQLYDGTLITEWAISNFLLSPAAQPGSAFYTIVPPLTPGSHYNNLNTGDTIKLFSIRTFNKSSNKDISCGTKVRFFKNGIDPASHMLA